MPEFEINAYTFHGLRLEGAIGESLRVKVLDVGGAEVGEVKNLKFDGKTLRGDVVVPQEYEKLKESLR